MRLACTLAGVVLAIVFSGCGNSSRAPTGEKAERSATPTSSAAKRGTAEANSLLAGIDFGKLNDASDADGQINGSCPRFTDIAAELGVVFQYENGDSPSRLMTQATGGGVAWIDFDRDGFSDVLLGQGGGPLPADRATNPLDQLYRNFRGERFDNITASSGLAESGFSQGAAVGDFDNDGFEDIYITNVGPDTFYRNLGDGTFRDETLSANLINRKWGSSAAWGDLDQDGDLDLFVCNYTKYDPEDPVKCFGSDGKPGVCHPEEVDPEPNVLFVNQGDGSFDPILASAGLDAPGSKSLGVVIADLNDDRVVDIYVANDTTANHLFLNEGDLQFREAAVQNGCAVNGSGLCQASMGVGFGDLDRDGHPDLYLTHFTSDSNTLYRGLGGGMFVDATQEFGLHLPTLRFLGFGTVIADFDCNGSEDIFVANGHIDESFQEQGDAFRMPAQLFANAGSQWMDCSSEAGPYFERKLLGRGVATADFDNDGDVDLAVNHQLDRAAILRNDHQTGHWLKLKFVGTTSNRAGIGVQVAVTWDGQTLHRQLAGGTSYCAAHEPAIFLGLGESVSDVSIEVIWPSGLRNALDSASVDQELVIFEPRRE